MAEDEAPDPSRPQQEGEGDGEAGETAVGETGKTGQARRSEARDPDDRDGNEPEEPSDSHPLDTGPVITRPDTSTGVLPPDRAVESPIGSVRQANKVDRTSEEADIPEDVRKYDRFKKVDGSQYERVNEFLRDRTYITAREWAIARLCSDFRTETGIEMTKIGENLPHLVPFMTDTYTPQAVNQARASFETKVRKSGATFLYGAMSDFFTADELDDIMYEVTEVAKFLLEVEGVDLAVDEELEGEERISSVMREVRSASDELRHEGTECPNCGHEIGSE